jgi:hypothetical protein
VFAQGVGEQIVADFKRFDWAWAHSLPLQLGWDGLSSNVLFVGMGRAFLECSLRRFGAATLRAYALRPVA